MLFPYQVSDLTHRLDSTVPTWSGGCGFHAEMTVDYPQGCRVFQYQMMAGAGTHMDAPSHFIPKAADIADIPVEQLVAPLCLLHLRIGDNQDYLVSEADILQYEATHGAIPRGALVVAHTGWSRHWSNPAAYSNLDSSGTRHFPGFSPEAAKLLLQRDVVGIGIDTLSPDGGNTNFPVHHLMLGAGKYILENLTHLADLPAQGAFAVALPINICGGTEAPCRVIALTER
jgi:kynurenine formamidase